MRIDRPRRLLPVALGLVLFLLVLLLAMMVLAVGVILALFSESAPLPLVGALVLFAGGMLVGRLSTRPAALAGQLFARN